MTQRIVPFGDSAVLVELGDTVDPMLNARAHAMALAIERERAAGAPWGQPIAAHASVLVPIDPLVLDAADAIERLRRTAVAALREEAASDPVPGAEDDTGERIVIDVHYGGDDGPDLPEVARLTGLSEPAVVAAHTAAGYRVYLLGFSPGFGYLGPLPAALEVPRRATPRARVPAGSVAIAGLQTAVYPLATPGGWQLIGRTDAVLWDVRRQPPALLRAGRHVRFRAVTAG